ncbi:NAD(P)-binding protein [Macroventuria anomochaeta]|uniref:NAD(P)-binding protein n=1 Tax=Macroventuria anomochaeta TaxID=301207 RepID=A0ACB6RSF2_9PLEO|nr:NAD(P)-binding protein [Macroventuria anomochaeta]KAF2624900.1 NAD(P)-binding protein [Macroventuria anomochaeta]
MPASTAERQIILITGANGGIGFDTAALLASVSPRNHVIVGSRNTTKGEAALEQIQDKDPKGTASLVQLDADDDASINAAVQHIKQDFGRLDVLINNAGICKETYDGRWPSREDLRAEFETNVFGPTVLSAALLPLLRQSKAPKIINVSSGLGSISRCLATPDKSPYGAIVRVPGYRMTKSALNMLTAYQYQQLKDEGFKVWSYCPGFVITDIGRDREARKNMNGCDSSETSAQGILEIIEGQRDEEVSQFLQKYGKRYDW